jgi:hypothetical protein
VSGLVTYWAFNSREFRVLLYTGFSRIEELSRNILVMDGCGVMDASGLNLPTDVLKKASRQFKETQLAMGGNRFVDELLFGAVHIALRKHAGWRQYLAAINKDLSDDEYDELYNFKDLRSAVMHGRVLFPTYRKFSNFARTIDKVGEVIEDLTDYLNRSPAVKT